MQMFVSCNFRKRPFAYVRPAKTRIRLILVFAVRHKSIEIFGDS